MSAAAHLRWKWLGCFRRPPFPDSRARLTRRPLRLQATTTATGTSTASTCAPRISVPVTLDSSSTASAIPTTTSAPDLDTLLSASVAALSSSYSGSAGAVCPLDPASPAIEVVSKLSVSVTMPAARMVAAAAAAGGDAVASACTSGPAALAASLGLGTGEAQVVGCELSAAVAGPITVVTDPPSSSGSGPAGAAGSDVTAASPQPTGAAASSGHSGGSGGTSSVLVGVAVAAGVAAAVVAAAAAVLVTRRRQAARAAAAENGEPLSGRSSKYDCRRPSLSGGGVEVFEPDSDDSAGQAMRDAALGAKRQRRVSYGGGGVMGGRGDSVNSGGGGGFFGRVSKTVSAK